MRVDRLVSSTIGLYLGAGSVWCLESTDTIKNPVDQVVKFCLKQADAPDLQDGLWAYGNELAAASVRLLEDLRVCTDEELPERLKKLTPMSDFALAMQECSCKKRIQLAQLLGKSYVRLNQSRQDIRELLIDRFVSIIIATATPTVTEAFPATHQEDVRGYLETLTTHLSRKCLLGDSIKTVFGAIRDLIQGDSFAARDQSSYMIISQKLAKAMALEDVARTLSTLIISSYRAEAYLNELKSKGQDEEIQAQIDTIIPLIEEYRDSWSLVASQLSTFAHLQGFDVVVRPDPILTGPTVRSAVLVAIVSLIMYSVLLD